MATKRIASMPAAAAAAEETYNYQCGVLRGCLVCMDMYRKRIGMLDS